MRVDLSQLETAAASDDAREQLWRAIEPMLWDLFDRPRFASHLAHAEEFRWRVIGAIRAYLATGLPGYLRARRLAPRLSFTRWLSTVAKRIAMAQAIRGAR